MELKGFMELRLKLGFLRWIILPGVALGFLLVVFFMPIFALAGNAPLVNGSSLSGSSGGGGTFQGGGAIAPADLQFREVNVEDLQEFLTAQGSYLAQYAGDFVSVAQSFNINPLLLVAITGQEQSFDPAVNSDAPEVARNPFNVYGSWMTYSPGFDTACEVAARTVATKLSYPVPSGEDPIQWIDDPANPTGAYAEDSSWWQGVKFWFQTLSARKNVYPTAIQGGKIYE